MAQDEEQSSDLSRNVSFSRLNAQAPEFVPSPRSDLHPIPPPPPPPPPALHLYHSHAPFHVPIRPHPHPHPHPIPIRTHHPHHLPIHYQQPQHQHHYYSDQDLPIPQPPPKPSSDHSASSSSKNKQPQQQLSDEATLKLLNQVEYYFSDLNLATTDHLMRFINKDPEGFVPISVVASFKKIKALINTHAQLATILRNSSKLVVSEDGKKVRRIHPLTELDMEELQSRIIVAENLPEDHCHQNLMKVFSSVGSVKTIRTCQPQTSNGGGSSAASRSAKSDNMLFSNKLHAFVEYESVELAEKAVSELNDERNWRSGLRVRLMFKRMSKPSQVRGRRGQEGDVQCEEEDACAAEQPVNGKVVEDAPQQSDGYSHDHVGEEQHGNEKEGGQKKGRSRGRGKGRGRGQYHHNNRGNNMAGTSPSNNLVGMEAGVTKQPPPPGPRMPDGTRGFAMGRGKPVAVNIA
ncbi:la-related protein 6B isoform X1 [Cannabis sativa]|uniref:la-related protein 6B isoform X1 n=1 Tax=Cannabis sativa TaxID=3483 RepID=UPI0029CA9EF6|nr:la-related protein 6B isoform X1 [Cannabis sativa]